MGRMSARSQVFIPKRNSKTETVMNSTLLVSADSYMKTEVPKMI